MILRKSVGNINCYIWSNLNKVLIYFEILLFKAVSAPWSWKTHMKKLLPKCSKRKKACLPQWKIMLTPWPLAKLSERPLASSSSPPPLHQQLHSGGTIPTCQMSLYGCLPVALYLQYVISHHISTICTVLKLVIWSCLQLNRITKPLMSNVQVTKPHYISAFKWHYIHTMSLT